MADDPKTIMSTDSDSDSQSGIMTEKRSLAKTPSLYRVLLLNDDFTPMDFVVIVLEKFFHKDHSAATEIMMHVHERGRGICGIYPYEVAETKVALVTEYARENEHPLQCTLEKV